MSDKPQPAPRGRGISGDDQVIAPQMVDADHYLSPAHGWTCFHCGETFLNPNLARVHFGAMPDATPGCMLRVQGKERGLLFQLREIEAEIARYREEDTDLHRRIAGMAADHGAALRREEEAGYARGLRDEQARSLRIITRIKAGLRNGGARNACDEIAADITGGRDG